MRGKRSVIRRDQICTCEMKMLVDLRDLNGLNAIQRCCSASTTAVPTTEQYFYLFRRGKLFLTIPLPAADSLEYTIRGGGMHQEGGQWQVAFLKHNSAHAS